ncbi:MAG: crotonase/enoyl-CoA hydratase family protein [Deltaproteobacteria bacterium]|nr:crotonase/enoyl-CoA hydratase family protein [Deltaproteobacteria bacterium]
MSDSYVGYELIDEIAHIQMDDGKANALGPQMIEQLSGAFDRAETEAEAVVLVGRPGRFCAGFDLKIMTSGPDNAIRLFTAGAEMFLKIYEHPLPVVAACSGHAMAGGALLLLVSDERIGVEGEFKLGLNEVAIGMVLPVLGRELVKSRIDPRRQAEVILGARVDSPEWARDVGFLDRLCAPDALLREAREAAGRLGAHPRVSYAGSKRAMREDLVRYVRDAMPADLERFTLPNAR